jgi:hypothetical protein
MSIAIIAYFFFFLSLPFRITLQVTDVLPARIRACEARPGLAKCGGMRRGSPEGRPSRMEPEGADSARSSYRLLSAV